MAQLSEKLFGFIQLFSQIAVHTSGLSQRAVCAAGPIQTAVQTAGPSQTTVQIAGPALLDVQTAEPRPDECYEILASSDSCLAKPSQLRKLLRQLG